MNHEDSIEKTRQSFETSFESEAFYNKQTRDEGHLEQIINYLSVKAGMKILDLGTGTGYLAFPFAERYPEVEVIGLDIVKQALEENRKKTKSKGLKNIQFISYDGITFPFSDHTFDMVISRYALHHFPAINTAFSEIARILKPDGCFFLSDPAPNDGDAERFVDAYMQMKKDGHIKFYTKKEWQELGKMAGLSYADGFETEIRFPKKKETAVEFTDIIKRFDAEIIKSYGVEVIDNEIWITEKVNNLLFLNEQEIQNKQETQNRTALLVIDMQADYIGGKSRNNYYASSLIDRINERIAEAVSRNEIVIYVKNKGRRKKEDYVCDFVQGLSIVSDFIVEKGQASVFADIALFNMLQEKGISEIEVTGIDGNCCVAASAVDAAKMGFSVSFPLNYIGIKSEERFSKTKEKLLRAKVRITGLQEE